VHAQLGTGAHFLWGNRVKEVLWAAGQTAGHPMTGEFVTRVRDLGLEGRHLATNNVHLDAREGRVTAQAWMAYWRVKTILEGAGLGLNDIIQEKIYLRSLKHLPAVERVRRGLYKPDSAPPHFYVEIVDVGRNTDCLIEVDAIAATRGRELLQVPGENLGRLGASGCAQGDFIYLGGWTARRGDGSIGGGLAAQAAWIYERLGEFLEENGSALRQLAKVDLYLREDAAIRALDAVHAAAFGGDMPALSIIPMRRIDHDDAVELKVSGVACRARR
jgi:enamine deaminase RidA (YjgF/YER057c/UK114 family)